MQLQITSLNSGSNGNCYYIGNEREAVLVDAGISCLETERRMKRLGLSMRKVKAIFISHEHSDHIRGVSVIARKYEIPVYITPDTQYHGRLSQERFTAIPFMAYEPVKIGELTITAFPKWHDASDPHSFIVNYQDINIGVFTDIGAPCEHVIKHFGMCHAAFLEANYDDGLLDKGRYPYHLKQRIRSNHGHLSNEQALSLFMEHKPSFMSHLLLSHLSKDNNNPMLVQNLFRLNAAGTEVVVASRYQETPIYTITNSFTPIKHYKGEQLQLL
ncbi:MBL fold metallo-hydrolase [Pontibacter sp. BT310]|uniref:MBL fold metallo-hydrolase n=1 Tax=Pontibacter populi TaxID=890055 RepID=A0ABS6X727_9BACT|nr:MULTISPECIES: MBL fold metallo-hydrolase [Pontibacter]MBJ6116576.1 MBL fold metallo-hydrolase [Pontibacter sp. BT310]MBR0569000.1 MBL fold metallo-hydrolase [Microvirga sp. STS03]MBW3363429.1 MBL fold metallo-hydrolase [Pontibacter populi]